MLEFYENIKKGKVSLSDFAAAVGGFSTTEGRNGGLLNPKLSVEDVLPYDNHYEDLLVQLAAERESFINMTDEEILQQERDQCEKYFRMSMDSYKASKKAAPNIDSLRVEINNWKAPELLSDFKKKMLHVLNETGSYIESRNFHDTKPVLEVPSETADFYRERALGFIDESIASYENSCTRYKQEYAEKVAFLKALVEEFPPTVAKP